MRLWHYDLISVLPNKMLVSQWRELIAMKRQWEKGTLKHRLVNYIIKYDKKYFLDYILSVVTEMNIRDIKFQEKYLKELVEFCGDDARRAVGIFKYPEHNKRYYEQCFYNLQEKFDRGIITESEYLEVRNQRIEFHLSRKED